MSEQEEKERKRSRAPMNIAIALFALPFIFAIVGLGTFIGPGKAEAEHAREVLARVEREVLRGATPQAAHQLTVPAGALAGWRNYQALLQGIGEGLRVNHQFSDAPEDIDADWVAPFVVLGKCFNLHYEGEYSTEADRAKLIQELARKWAPPEEQEQAEESKEAIVRGEAEIHAALEGMLEHTRSVVPLMQDCAAFADIYSPSARSWFAEKAESFPFDSNVIGYLVLCVQARAAALSMLGRRDEIAREALITACCIDSLRGPQSSSEMADWIGIAHQSTHFLESVIARGFADQALLEYLATRNPDRMDLIVRGCKATMLGEYGYFKEAADNPASALDSVFAPERFKKTTGRSPSSSGPESPSYWATAVTSRGAAGEFAEVYANLLRLLPMAEACQQERGLDVIAKLRTLELGRVFGERAVLAVTPFDQVVGSGILIAQMLERLDARLRLIAGAMLASRRGENAAEWLAAQPAKWYDEHLNVSVDANGTLHATLARDELIELGLGEKQLVSFGYHYWGAELYYLAFEQRLALELPLALNAPHGE